ncbi:MAG: GNAT family N-acetyltransferase, partial [Candidatus Heimdallarchaeota archaeon]|nr:GNAT family N-acetyltransferase [Candidatus Heimdallarchaeota archaeon]
MRWREETNFNNIANFLGQLFGTDSKEINERFVDLEEMFVLKFVDDDEVIHGTIIAIRDNKEPSIVELIYTAFEVDFDFELHNPFQRLINYSKTEYIDIIYTNTYVSENSFVNVDLDYLSNYFTTRERVTMNLSEKQYKSLWYDETGEKLDLLKYDYLKANQSLKLSKKKKSAKFKMFELKDVTLEQIATLQRKVYSTTEFEDNLHILSKEKSDYNLIHTSRLLNNYYGELDEDISLLALTDKGILAGYILGMKSFIKSGFIIDFAVDPAFQGYGLGKVLFRNAIIKYFEKFNCENVGVEVTLSNE